MEWTTVNRNRNRNRNRKHPQDVHPQDVHPPDIIKDDKEDLIQVIYYYIQGYKNYHYTQCKFFTVFDGHFDKMDNVMSSGMHMGLFSKDNVCEAVTKSIIHSLQFHGRDTLFEAKHVSVHITYTTPDDLYYRFSGLPSQEESAKEGIYIQDDKLGIMFIEGEDILN